MKVPTKSIGCDMKAYQVIVNHGYKPEEYFTNGKRVLVLVNTRTGERITNRPNENSFEDICKRLRWM